MPNWNIKLFKKSGVAKDPARNILIFKQAGKKDKVLSTRQNLPPPKFCLVEEGLREDKGCQQTAAPTRPSAGIPSR